MPYYLIGENGISYSCCETMIGVGEELVPAFYINATKKSPLLFFFLKEVIRGSHKM